MLLVESSSAVAELAKGLKKSERLQLVFSDEVKQKIADGTYKLMKRKDADGIFKAVVIDKKGKTRAIADLQWEEIGNGVDPASMTAAMQKIKRLVQKEANITLLREELEISCDGICSCDNKMKLYHFLRTQLGDKRGRCVYSVINEEFLDMKMELAV